MQTGAISVRWISGRNYDLLLYIGACLSGYLLIYCNVALGVPALFLFWIWIVSVDGPHVFATISRTYLDSREWKERSRLLLGSLAWFLVGPIIVFLSILLGTKLPFFTFLTLAQLWAYWHVVRQHYGFLVLYQKKNGEAAGKLNRTDYWIFYILMLAPFVSFLLRHPEARAQVGLPPWISKLETYALVAVHAVIAVALIWYLAKEIRNWSRGLPLNVPKNLFLLACVPLHMLIFLHPYVSTHVDIRLFAVFVTFYHNIQYHGIVWFYNRNRYGSDPDGKQFGLAGKVSRSFLTYYLAGIVFTLMYRYPNWFLTGLPVPFATGPSSVSQATLGPLFTISDLAIGFWWGFAFNHYFLDQKIWKLSKDKQLTKDLRVA